MNRNATDSAEIIAVSSKQGMSDESPGKLTEASHALSHTSGDERVSLPVQSDIVIPTQGDEGGIAPLGLGYPEPHPLALLFPRMSESEQRELESSIRQAGVRDSITMLDGMILDGCNRCSGASRLGIAFNGIPKRDFDPARDGDPLRYVVDKNLARRHLNESQRAMVAARLSNMGQGARTDLAQYCARSQEQAADAMGVSRRLVQHARVVLEQGVPELQNAVDRGELAVSQAAKVVGLKLPAEVQQAMVADALAAPKPAKAMVAAARNAANHAHHDRIVASARRHDLGGSRFPIGLADVPWPGDISRGELSPYPQLSIDEICAFKTEDGRSVRDVLADEAVLYFWIIDQHLADAEKILKAWGDFAFRLSMPWPKPKMGMGQYARNQHESIWVCTRGQFSPPAEGLRHSTLIVGKPLASADGFQFEMPHDERHSSKPDRLYQMIEEAYPQYFGRETVDQPLALELFARKYRPRWAGQGFEYPGRPDAEKRDAAQVGVA